jgi:hypothetical protein
MGGSPPKPPAPPEDKAAKFAAENRKRTNYGYAGFKGTVLGSMLDYASGSGKLG